MWYGITGVLWLSRRVNIAKYFVRVNDAVCWSDQERVKTLIDLYRMMDACERAKQRM